MDLLGFCLDRCSEFQKSDNPESSELLDYSLSINKLVEDLQENLDRLKAENLNISQVMAMMKQEQLRLREYNPIQIYFKR